MATPRTDSANLLLTIDNKAAGNSIKDLNKQATDLRRKLERLDINSDDFKKASEELKQVNTQLKNARDATKPLATAIAEVRSETSLWQRSIAGVVAVFGGLSLDRIVDGLRTYATELFNIGVSQDSLVQKTRTVFGESEVIIQAFAEKNAQSLGLARQEFVNLATGIGDLLVPMGFTQSAAAGLSDEIVRQAGVLSEWTGGKFSTTEASEILNKALLGEREGLNALGIDIKQSVVNDELKKRGQDKLTGSALRQAEALVTLNEITRQSASANEAFEKNTGSLVRTKAVLRARIAEVNQNLASALIPTFTLALNAADKLLTGLIVLGKALIAIPSFISENRVAFGLLIVSLVTLNFQTLAAAANTISWNIALRSAAIYTSAQAAAQRLLNLAMAANPIGLVIAAVAALVGVFTTAYNRSETFRASILALGDVASEIVGIIGDLFKNVAGGFTNLLSGDFSAAADNFGNLFTGIGGRVKKAFNDGFNREKSSIDADKLVKETEGSIESAKAKSEREKAEKEAADKAAKEAQEAARQRAEEARKKAAEAAKKALDAALKETELDAERRKLVLAKFRLDGTINEERYQNGLTGIQQLELEKQLAAYRKFGQDKTLEALRIQTKLVEIQQGQKIPTVAPLAALPGQPIAGVRSQTATNGLDATARVGAVDDEAALRERFNRLLINELEYNRQLAALRVNAAQERLRLLQEAGLQETEVYKTALQAKLDADNNYHETIRSNEEKTKEIKRAVSQASYEIANDAINLAIGVLGRDEAARKKHATAIKAFEIAQIGINLASEIQGIYKNANSNPINTLIPGWGPIFANVQTGFAIGRAALQTNKILATKGFAGGGYTGQGFGFTDQSGHRPAGVVHDNEWVAPKWMAQHPVYGQYIGALENFRTRGYADGGYASVSTTPTPSVGGVQINAGGFNISMFENVVSRFELAVEQMPRRVKADVVYTEIEDAGTTLNTVRNDASF
jgi:cell division septum initiation protein DivIVA